MVDPAESQTQEVRLTDVEIRIAFLERSLSQLDDVVRGLADQMDLLRRELRELRETLGTEQVTFRASALDDVPPHY